jgi:hypothetical protein
LNKLKEIDGEAYATAVSVVRRYEIEVREEVRVLKRKEAVKLSDNKEREKIFLAKYRGRNEMENEKETKFVITDNLDDDVVAIENVQRALDEVKKRVGSGICPFATRILSSVDSIRLCRVKVQMARPVKVSGRTTYYLRPKVNITCADNNYTGKEKYSDCCYYLMKKKSSSRDIIECE